MFLRPLTLFATLACHFLLACSPGSPANGSAGAGGGLGALGGSPGSGGASVGGQGPSTGGAYVGGAGSGGAAVGGAGSGSAAVGGGSSSTNGGTASASGGAAGSGGAPSGGAASGGQASAEDVCAKAGVLLCEDFERGAIGEPPGAPWALAMNGSDGTALIDGTTPAHSGQKSLWVSSAGNYQTFVALSGAPVFPATGALYVRVFVRLSEPMTSGHNTYFKAGAAGSLSSEHETRVGVMLEMLMINQPAGDRGFLSNQSYWTDNQLGAVVPAQTWTCVEGFFDAANSTVRFWLDETEVEDLHVTDWQQDPIGVLHFGFEKYAGPDTSLWYDDIVVSEQSIGCGPIAP